MALLSKRIWNNQQTFISIWSAKQSSIVNITEDGFKRHLKRLEDFRLSFKDHFCTNFYRVGLSQPTSQTLSDKKNASSLNFHSWYFPRWGKLENIKHRGRSRASTSSYLFFLKQCLLWSLYGTENRLNLTPKTFTIKQYICGFFLIEEEI